jgi:hypothetical protein
MAAALTIATAFSVPGLEAAAPAAAPDSPVLFAIDGVSQGGFQHVDLRSSPDPKDHICAILSGSTGNVHDLAKWMDSNNSIGALASKPEATISLTTGDHGAKAQYRLSRVQILDFIESPGAGPLELRKVEVICEGIRPVAVASRSPK